MGFGNDVPLARSRLIVFQQLAPIGIFDLCASLRPMFHVEQNVAVCVADLSVSTGVGPTCVSVVVLVCL